jgi:hypothetical protein
MSQSQSLDPGWGGDILLDSRISQERFDIILGEIRRVFQLVVEDIALDPGRISLSSAVGVVFPAQGIQDAVEEFFSVI